MTPSPSPLRLIAHDADDLAVISTLLQDALVRHADMTFDRRRRRFALAVSRFRWEAGKARERIRTGVHFNHVLGVQHQGIALDKRDTVAELLAVRTAPADDGGVALTLDFAGGGTIRLEAECIDAEVRDLGDTWAARRTPDHSAAD
ncbi:MAG: DUF2948 family protein [Alphaproteobacteria bacterium]|jgi:hypothetical protein